MSRLAPPAHAWRPWRLYTTSVEMVLANNYDGKGTEEEPFLVDWLADDPENPQVWPGFVRWLQLSLIGFATLSLTAASSAYGAAQPDLESEFHVSGEVTLLGISLFVLGFGAGPLIWSPLSDIYGRRTMYIFSFGMLTLWTSVTIASQNIASVLVFRFLAGFFGGVPLSSAGASVADMFPLRQRGIAIAVFVSTAFLGPAVGPITGGFIAERRDGVGSKDTLASSAVRLPWR
jgi:MFS family permease